MLTSTTRRSGTKTFVSFTLFEPLACMPMNFSSPQSGRISTVSRGVTKKTCFGGPSADGHEAAADEVGRDRNARGEGPDAVHNIAAFGLGHLAEGTHDMGGAEFAVCAEELALRVFGPVRSHEIGVRACEREAPAAARLAAGNLHDHFEEDRRLELVAAEEPRLHDPVEARRAERLVDFLRIVPAPVVLLLCGAQERAHGRGARDERLGGEPGLGLGEKSTGSCLVLQARHGGVSP